MSITSKEKLMVQDHIRELVKAREENRGLRYSAGYLEGRVEGALMVARTVGLTDEDINDATNTIRSDRWHTS